MFDAVGGPSFIPLTGSMASGGILLEYGARRARGPAVWVYRWWEENIEGKLVHGKPRLGDLKVHPTESSAQAAADALRLTINNTDHSNARGTTVRIRWEHYCREELSRNELSTQDSYLAYTKNWILPKWGDHLLDQVRTVPVERWLETTPLANGTKAKIKCVMFSALLSCCSLGVFDSQSDLLGSPGWNGRKTRTVYGCRRQLKTSKVSAVAVTGRSQTKPGQTRISRPAAGVSGWLARNPPGRIGSVALARPRFRGPELQRRAFVLLAPRREPKEHKNGRIGEAPAHAPELERRFARVEIAKASTTKQRTLSSPRSDSGKTPLDLASALKKKIQSGL